MPRLETGVGICEKDHTCGINGRPCLQCGNEFTPSKLLYPVRQKDYATDIFIRNEWDRLGDALGHGYFLTIFGYSAPKTDVEARKLMLGDWKGNSTLQLAEVEVIDVKPTEELEANWEEFFVKTHYMIRDNVLIATCSCIQEEVVMRLRPPRLCVTHGATIHFPALDRLWICRGGSGR